MKRLFFICLLCLFIIIPGMALAAGTCVKTETWRTVLYRMLDLPYGFVYECTSDASDASVTPLEIEGLGGFLQAVEIEMDGTATPTSVAVSVQTQLGNEIYASGTQSASKYLPTDQPYGFANGLILAPTFVGNSKKAKVVLYVF